ncbi:MAG: GntR family transcriptional regulator [Firmicutes bacterium]|nr:GntR family transcriptional regulator [Bacillota bacterium]MCM1401220.1 GntR family transcriptional regulator [Bacteroides sp.]MCM1477083.1 GntR family transcriptional regulator [Bacteroides sp.]
MNFKENNKAIFLQIADRICDNILSGEYAPDSRIPSVRTLAAEIEVNANTVMRAYEYLSLRGVVTNKRGIGFFIAPNATELVTDMRRSEFLESELGNVFHQLRLLNISPEQLKDMYNNYLDSK